MKTSTDVLCPSAQPAIEGSVAFAVVDRDGDRPEAQWLESTVPVTPELLKMAEPVPPTQVFRFAATCQETACLHFDGTNCRLATRITNGLAAHGRKTPPCTIRAHCRWFKQEGIHACLRCSQVATEYVDPSSELEALARPERLHAS